MWVGEMGVGGGAAVPSGWPSECAGFRSVPVSESEEMSSSSHESTTSFFVGLSLVVFLPSDV